jgi:hypothetical protein
MLNTLHRSTLPLIRNRQPIHFNRAKKNAANETTSRHRMLKNCLAYDIIPRSNLNKLYFQEPHLVNSPSAWKEGSESDARRPGGLSRSFIEGK